VPTLFLAGRLVEDQLGPSGPPFNTIRPSTNYSLLEHATAPRVSCTRFRWLLTTRSCHSVQQRPTSILGATTSLASWVSLHKPDQLASLRYRRRVWVNDDGELIVADHKATSKNQGKSASIPDWQMSYKRQLEVPPNGCCTERLRCQRHRLLWSTPTPGGLTSMALAINWNSSKSFHTPAAMPSGREPTLVKVL